MNNDRIEDYTKGGSINIWELLAYWKTILAGGIIGLLLGAGVSYFSSYAVKATIINNGASDFLAWRNLKSNLPILASKILHSQKFTNSKEQQEMKKLSVQKWWENNFVPTFAVSKTDTKDLLPQSTDLREIGTTKIVNYIVTSSAKTKDEAIAGVQIDSVFFQTGASYFALKTLINDYDVTAINTNALLQKTMSNVEVALTSLKKREENLRKLTEAHKNESTNQSIQMLAADHINATMAKFLPLSMQLIAVESEINQQNETLDVTKGLMEENSFLETFVKLALPVIDSNFDGIKSAEELHQILQEKRKTIDAKNLNTLNKLNTINADITGILTTYRKGLYINVPPDAKKPIALIKLLLGGLLLGLFLTFIGIFIHKSWFNYNSRRAF
jgi:hypothetical protein